MACNWQLAQKQFEFQKRFFSWGLQLGLSKRDSMKRKKKLSEKKNSKQTFYFVQWAVEYFIGSFFGVV